MPIRLPTFRLKLAASLLLVAGADVLLFDRYPGAGVGVLSLSLLAAAVATNPAILHRRLGIFALVAAAWFALLQVERATLLGGLLFALALGVAALAPRAGEGEDALRWTRRLAVAGVKGLFGPILDLRPLRQAAGRRPGPRAPARLAAAALPVAGGAVFLGLFAAANPLIAEAFARLRLPAIEPARLVFWGLAGAVAWTALRPRGLKPRLASRPRRIRDGARPVASTASVAASLVVFNLVFALQNGLDAAFLWSGARLPSDMSHAEYAHRGAYPLVATALLAGAFVLVFLRPGSATSASRPVRALLAAWIAQNLFLLVSTALRTLEYVDAYALTRTRIAALLWMGLVAAGLALIAWRLLAGRSGRWLVNANAACAGAVLVLCSLVDLGAVAAAWNVRHAREVGGRGVSLDLCYLGRLEGAALVSLAELEQRPLPPDLADRVRWKRQEVRAGILRRQADWRSWRWRDARRLARDAGLPGALPPPLPGERGCDGRPRPLTPPAKPGT